MPSPAARYPPRQASLAASGVRREIANQLVLGGISLTLGPADCVGVVGPNGVGKSTLLRVLAGLEKPDAGRVEVAPPSARVGYLAQDRARPAGETVASYLRRVSGVTEAEAEFADAAAALATGTPGPDAADRYSTALERLNLLAPDSFVDRAEQALADLGSSGMLMAGEVATISGGELARVHLVATMLAGFDITLLDEPTNDLDFVGLERLEGYVNGLSGARMVVSHDRAFLAHTVNSVLEIDPHTRQAAVYTGGWDSYLAERATAARHRQQAYDRFRQSRDELAARAQRERQWATTGTGREKRKPRDNDKVQRDFRLNRTEQLAARARRTERAIERLDTVEKPWQPWELRYELKMAPRAGTVVAALREAVVQRGTFVLGPVSLTVEWGARWAVTGRNGSGKTTLVDALLGRATLASGACVLGPSVVAGELGQERGDLASGDGNELPRRGSLLDQFLAVSGLDLSSARSLLAKFGLGPQQVGRTMPTLSPGERTRARLACFQAAGVNFLVLDEPTNHLDLPAIEQLEDALAGFEGTLLIVSHDRRLLDQLRLTHRAHLERGRVDVTAV
ncbi:MAG TPA: ATP-binding cassette domain-containing protein [Acidimicrobiales bacterium]|nr:ATP-binding cassette domain-containing protein [Acidimicrobiales bacterium]